jgi:hypothetical protein
MAAWRHGLRALRHRNFRLYVVGLLVSQAGTYMQQVAEGWLIYRLTNSAFSLGLVGFIVLVPLLPWALVSGALADRMSRRTLMLLAQFGQMVPPLGLAWVIWSGQVHVWHVIVADICMAAFGALDQPTRQALVANTTDLADLDSAITISAASFSVARVLGPALAGSLIALFGETICFTVNGLSFLAVAAALLAMRLPAHSPVAHAKSLSASLLDGLHYVRTDPVLLALIGVLLLMNLFIVPVQVLLPVFARDILASGAEGLGWLTAGAGAGAVVGSLLMLRVSTTRPWLVISWLSGVMVIALLAFAVSRNFGLSSLSLTVLTGAIIAAKVLATAQIQGRLQDEMRGRVMSLVTLVEAGIPRLGGLGIGLLAGIGGATLALSLAAASYLAAALGLRRWALPTRNSS